ncbi:MAG: 50S ribosomal protein L15 [Candidatus Magasanikbacteria bacterium GW2011_GWA2_46_17]|uniref:50S ribosomal protein L15 n=1 Tax=Candidatus Magasanikbacteria bacterium GW2011_GWA2_46_17 TaxID=1619042 RepID=A0A0G1P365_9BACT|nr:MAG: 50S ribosomal protein L15 [Candidatus Magasanikbacteria bacterium GW2011_GWA2_46_17]
MRQKPAEVALEKLEKNFAEGETVTLASLREKGLVGKNAMAVKILSAGAISKKISVQGILLTKSAAEKIKTAGGEVK